MYGSFLAFVRFSGVHCRVTTIVRLAKMAAVADVPICAGVTGWGAAYPSARAAVGEG